MGAANAPPERAAPPGIARLCFQSLSRSCAKDFLDAPRHLETSALELNIGSKTPSRPTSNWARWLRECSPRHRIA